MNPLMDARTSKSKNTFVDTSRTFFNSASIGMESQDAAIAAGGDLKGSWDELVEQAATSMARLIGGVPANITFFHNTTAGVQRIFLRLSHLFGSSFPTLLTTDLEYPGIIAMVDENWNGRLIMTKVADLVNRGESHLVKERLKQSILATRPSVVYLSHVGRASGYRLDESVLDFIKEVDRRPVVIIDGAQACGNINVDRSILDKVDFYVTSGHKWLCARQTLGIVYAHGSWQLKDPAQSYSKTQSSSGTGNSPVLLSFKMAVADFNGELSGETELRMKDVEEHNAYLARHFSTRLKDQLGWHSIGEMNGDHWKWSGIVTVDMRSQQIIDHLKAACGDAKFTVLEGENWRDRVGGDPPGPRYSLDSAATKADEFFRPATFVGESIPGTGPYWSRFCFHYYHQESDVDALIDLIDNARRVTYGR